MPIAPAFLPLIDAALRGAVVSALLLFVAAVLRRPRSGPAAGPAVALAIGLIVQAISSTPIFEALLPLTVQAPWIAVSVGNGVLFWLLARALFDDDFRLQRRHVLLWALVVLGTWANCQWRLPLGMAGLLLQRAVPVVSALGALWTLLRHWQGDLVEWRRQLRAFLVVTGSVYAVVMAALRLASVDGRLGERAALLDMACQLLIGAVVARRLMAVGLDNWLGDGEASARGESLPLPRDAQPDGMPVDAVVAADAPPVHPWAGAAPQATETELPLASPLTAPDSASSRNDPAPESDPAPAPAVTVLAPVPPSPPIAATSTAAGLEGEGDRDAASDLGDREAAFALERQVREQCLYREEAMTLPLLAKRLGVPEYRLRRLINTQLGHRNFNAFLNRLRLADACRMLASDEHRNLPVLSIALESGFQSIGPFNRAFKVETGLTPTEFRQQAIGTSQDPGSA